MIFQIHDEGRLPSFPFSMHTAGCCWFTGDDHFTSSIATDNIAALPVVTVSLPEVERS